MTAAALTVVLAAAAGGLAGSVLACVPGLHIYNTLALLALAVGACDWAARPDWVIPLSTGLIVAFAVANTIPSVLVAAPDESAFFTVLPGQKLLMSGRGLEAALLTTAGAVAGLAAILLVAAPLAPRVLPAARAILQPHWHWVLWCVIAFLLLSEWPREVVGPGQAGWARFLRNWRSLGAGILTFLLAGLLGFILLYRSPIPPSAAFQNLMPAFVGLFTAPWLLLNTVSRAEAPRQRERPFRVDGISALRGSVAGVLGGGFAAFAPVVTGGVGGFLAGHATAMRDDRAFLISQGASKTVYYVGGLLLFFVPGLRMTRGGGAWLIQGLVSTGSFGDYFMALASIATAGAVSLLLFVPLARGMIRAIHAWGYRRLSACALALVSALVPLLTGWTGLPVMLTAAGIGLIPVLFGARRMNALGVILLPMACNMSGIGPSVARALGLL
ncbi:MAG: tripartite tricarboxylate transporter permease [Verrucomicrobiota bacterium]|nr:tripartite tricarboxylate transporter permease [Verrucomicrobiota bacterium]